MEAVITPIYNFLKTKIIYPITKAKAVKYDNAESGMDATNVQDAITSLNSNFVHGKLLEVLSGNVFQVYKYEDGYLETIVDIKTNTTYSIALLNNGTYYASANLNWKFPIPFVDAPSMICGLANSDLGCPFVNVTMDGVTKDTIARILFYSSTNNQTVRADARIRAVFYGKWM